MASTKIGKHIDAPRSTVYRLLLDAEAVATWMVPTGMTSEVHEFEPREGGAFRISLTHDEPTDAGKTTDQTDTFNGRFVTLIPDEQVVEIVEFETDDPAVRGEMTITLRLADAAGGGTDLMALHDGVPSGVLPADNELGWRISLGKLAALAETGTVPE
ncbi:SRPBCC family protein [Nocardia sp. NPDC050710]|uniref:SRPBCC family protein n=1 Tax=Nocardia sp. NPDC050710 TaxID=3157220 RepID=UPI0033DE9905